jgi:hypothetical protein
LQAQWIFGVWFERVSDPFSSDEVAVPGTGPRQGHQPYEVGLAFVDRVIEQDGCLFSPQCRQVRQVGVIEVLGCECGAHAGFYKHLQCQLLGGFVHGRRDVIMQLVKDVRQQLADHDIVTSPAHGLDLVRHQLG